MAAADSSGQGGSDLGYHLPTRPLLSAEEERALSAQILRGIDELAVQFEPVVWRLTDGFDPGAFAPSELAAAAFAGLRNAVIAYLVNPDGGPGAFLATVIDNVRKSVTPFVDRRQRDGGAVQNAAQWVAERLTDAAFEAHLPTSADVGDILTQGQRNLSVLLNEMVEANMRLASATARRFGGRGLDFEDLCQEAVLAIHKAALVFDPAEGCKFGTFAVPVIENRLRSAIRTAKGLKENQACQVEEFRVAEASLAHELKRPPTAAEVFGRLPTWSPEVCKSVQAVLRALKPGPLPEREETNETSMADSSSDVPSQAEARESSRRLLTAIARLPEDERQVIVLHNFQHLTFAQVGQSLGLSVDRARRRHEKGLETLNRELAGTATPAQNRERA